MNGRDLSLEIKYSITPERRDIPLESLTVTYPAGNFIVSNLIPLPGDTVCFNGNEDEEFLVHHRVFIYGQGKLLVYIVVRDTARMVVSGWRPT